MEDDLPTTDLHFDRICEAQLRIAPAFRDKFDYSDPKHFDDLAEITWKAAVAIIDKQDKEAIK